MRDATRGSEWRKWDLQVHTPYSELNNQFGPDFDEWARRLLNAACEHSIAAIGVTDYFSIRGYTELRALLDDRPRLESLVGQDVADYSRDLLILPNIEFRLSDVVRGKDGKTSRVNYHVLFSDEIDPTAIQENFVSMLTFTSESSPGARDEELSLTATNLEALGRRLKQQQPEFANQTDLYVGMMNAVVSHHAVTAELEKRSLLFGGKHLLIAVADEDLPDIKWDDQGHLVRKLLIQKAHVLLSSNAKTREWGLGKFHDSEDDFVAEFKSLKPCVWSSDAHDYSSMFRPSLGRQTWIKADPTFDGLRQILWEPAARIHIGGTPPALEHLRSRATKVIESVGIHRRSGSLLAEPWFDVELELNPGLVAVIGNKGGGKSALADVLGLLGNSSRLGHFSFLNAKRFRHPRDGRASEFEASMTWADGSVVGPTVLDGDVEPSAVETIKYIPQNYLEEICNEVDAGRDSAFYHELEAVIFSHIPLAERLGHADLASLLDGLGEQTARSLESRRLALSRLNTDLHHLEQRAKPSVEQSLRAQLAEKQRELASHDAQARPLPTAPEEDPDLKAKSAEALKAIEALRSEEGAHREVLAALAAEDAELAQRAATAEKLVQLVGNLERDIAAELEANSEAFAAIGVAADAVLSVTANLDPLSAVIASARARREEIGKLVDSETPDSPAAKALSASESMKAIMESLSLPQVAYQEAVSEAERWRLARDQIMGSPDVPGSLLALETSLAQLKGISSEVERLRARRRRACLEIYRDIERLRRQYAKYYAPVQESPELAEASEKTSVRLTFSASIAPVDVASTILDVVHQGRQGPLLGVDEGRAWLEDMLEKVSFSSARAVVRFAERILDLMTRHDGRELDIADQLKSGHSVPEFYDLIFGLEYLSPLYELRWAGRTVDALSPGERGNLLLVFYLMLDLDDAPLIIDQPEENLDNQTIYEVLVPCMRKAKERRQIVMVTHNPNLAVVCDADQVIRASFDKDTLRVGYVSGSIESRQLNRDVVDVLEGTRPAFRQRDARYLN